MSIAIDPRELRAPQWRENDLLSRLPELLVLAQSSPGWARLLQHVDAGTINSRAALATLPITRKSDLLALQRAAPPFGGLLASNPQQLRRIFMSPGPIFDPEGSGQDWWRFAPAMRALGLQRGDLLQNCFSYHFTPAAFMVEGAAAQLGCVVIPAGVGQTEMQVQAMAELKPVAYLGTPSFLKRIIEKAQEMGIDIASVQRALVSAEALPPSLRSWLNDHGVALVLQLYASADIGAIAFETATGGVVNPGMVLDEDLLLEIVRPGTGDLVAPGEVGEVVVTSFNRDYPLVRFATGDLSALLPGTSPCGRTNQRIKGWMGRADQTTKVRAMFVHPAQVAEIVRRFPAILKARLVVSGQLGEDHMTLQYETATPDAVSADALAAAIRDVTKLRGEVAMMAPGGLPNDGKVIDDLRRFD